MHSYSIRAVISFPGLGIGDGNMASMMCSVFQTMGNKDSSLSLTQTAVIKTEIVQARQNTTVTVTLAATYTYIHMYVCVRVRDRDSRRKTLANPRDLDSFGGRSVKMAEYVHVGGLFLG